MCHLIDLFFPPHPKHFLGEKGYAYTLITDKDKEFAPLLVRNLEGANQYAPPALLDLAMQVCLNSIHLCTFLDICAHSSLCGIWEGVHVF